MNNFFRLYLLWKRHRIDRALYDLVTEREKLYKRRAKVIAKLADLDQPLDYPIGSR